MKKLFIITCMILIRFAALSDPDHITTPTTERNESSTKSTTSEVPLTPTSSPKEPEMQQMEKNPESVVMNIESRNPDEQIQQEKSTEKVHTTTESIPGSESKYSEGEKANLQPVPVVLSRGAEVGENEDTKTTGLGTISVTMPTQQQTSEQPKTELVQPTKKADQQPTEQSVDVQQPTQQSVDDQQPTEQSVDEQQPQDATTEQENIEDNSRIKDTGRPPSLAERMIHNLHKKIESLEEDKPEGPIPCTCGVFLSGQFKKGSKQQPKGNPVLTQEMDTPFMNNAMGNRQCTNKCLELIIKHLPKSSEIICATVDRENVFKERAYLFVKNHSDKWHGTNLSAGREFCCKENTPYKCPVS